MSFFFYRGNQTVYYVVFILCKSYSRSLGVRVFLVRSWTKEATKRIIYVDRVISKCKVDLFKSDIPSMNTMVQKVDNYLLLLCSVSHAWLSKHGVGLPP